MHRVSRALTKRLCVHALSRSNGRATVFHDASDYRNFTDLVRKGSQIVKLPVLAWCVMPNHFHVVVRPDGARDLSRWMHWVLTSHVQRHRLRYQTVGRIWQGRYKAFPIQTDHHLLTVLRYVERNPVTAGLVSNARLWRWSSHPERVGAAGGALFLAPSPVELP